MNYEQLKLISRLEQHEAEFETLFLLLCRNRPQLREVIRKLPLPLVADFPIATDPESPTCSESPTEGEATAANLAVCLVLTLIEHCETQLQINGDTASWPKTPS